RPGPPVVDGDDRVDLGGQVDAVLLDANLLVPPHAPGGSPVAAVKTSVRPNLDEKPASAGKRPFRASSSAYAGSNSIAGGGLRGTRAACRPHPPRSSSSPGTSR